MIDCQFENGSKANLRHAVVHCLVIEDGKILLVKRSEKIIEGGKWGFPGGFLDQGEDIKECAVRELKEETGYDGEVLELFRINSNPNRKNDNGRNNVAFEFLMKAHGKTGEPDWEQTEVEWFEIDKIDLTLIAFDQDRSIEILRKFLKGEIQKQVFE